MGTGVHDGRDVAGVVGVVVGQEDPADVVRGHQAEDVVQPAGAVPGRTGVDDDRFRAEDDRRVDVDGQRLAEGVLDLLDQVRPRGDLLRGKADGVLAHPAYSGARST